MPIDIPRIMTEAEDLLGRAKKEDRCSKEAADLEDAIKKYREDAPFYWQDIMAIGAAVLLDLIAMALGGFLVGMLVFAGTGALIMYYTKDHRVLRETRAEIVKMRSEQQQKCLGL